MENDDIKSAWQALGAKLESQQSMQFEWLRERRTDRLQRSLRPLFWGQALQVLLGIGMIVLGVACWNRNLQAFGYLLAGIVVHLYGIACIALSGITMGLVGTLDYSAPVLKIQKRLTLLRKSYLFGAVLIGLPWWIMWIVVVVAFAGLAGNPPHGGTPAWVWISLAVGALGLLATWGLYRWSHADPRRVKLAKWMDNAISVASLRKAQAQLDELHRFEREADRPAG